VVLNNVILSTPIVCIVLVIINKYLFIILRGHTIKLTMKHKHYYDRNFCHQCTTDRSVQDLILFPSAVKKCEDSNTLKHNFTCVLYLFKT